MRIQLEDNFCCHKQVTCGLLFQKLHQRQKRLHQIYNHVWLCPKSQTTVRMGKKCHGNGRRTRHKVTTFARVHSRHKVTAVSFYRRVLPLDLYYCKQQIYLFHHRSLAQYPPLLYPKCSLSFR